MTVSNFSSDGGADALWSTDSFDHRSRMARWTDLVSLHMTEMAVSSDAPERYQAAWRQYGLGPIDLNFVASSPQHIHRTPQMVARGGSSSFELVYMKYGSIILRSPMGRRECGAGDFALLDNAEPYDFLCPQPCMGLSIHFEADWLRRWLPDGLDLEALSPDQRRAWGGPLGALLLAIDARGLSETRLPRATIADQIGSLMALMAGERMPALARHKAAMLKRARDLLRDLYRDPELDPQALARAMGISKRSLHSLFAETGTTFGQMLVTTRLDAAGRLLGDGALRSVGEVAYAVGFNDSSHFAKRFRLRFGCSPSVYRKQVD